MGTVIGALEAYMTLNIENFESNLKAAQKQVASISSGFDVLSSVGDSIAKAGMGLVAGVTAPVLALGTSCVKTTSDFDAAMTKVSAISGATGNDLLALRDKAKEMGAATKFSAKESADAFTYMAMAGWDTQQMLDGISGIMSLAAADGLDLATTSDIVTDALTAFGLQASDSGHFADVLATASSRANTNVAMLGESFKYVAPVAGALGYSVEDTAVALGLMANAGIKGSQAGTALRAAISRMVKPTGDAQKVMRKYGLSLTNADGSMKSFGDVMVDLRQKLGGLTEAQQAQVAATLFGQEAMSGMLAIINASESDFEKLTEAINNADGTAQSMADTMNDNLAGQLVLLKSQLEGVAIQIGEVLVPHIRNFLTQVSDWISKFSDLFSKHGDLIIKIALIAAALGPVLVVVGKTISFFGKMGSAFNNISALIKAMNVSLATAGTSIGAIAGPILAAVAVIGILAAAFKHLWETNDQFKNSMTAIWNGIVASVQSFCQGIVDRINSLGFDFQNVTDVLKSIWEGFCSFLAPVFEGAFSLISTIISTALNAVLGIVDVFIALFQGNWQGAWDAVLGIASSIWAGIVEAFSTVMTTLKNVADVVLGWFGSSWSSVWSAVSSFFVGVWNSIVAFFQGIVLSLQTIMGSIGTFITSTWSAITSAVTGIVGQLASLVMTYFGDMFMNISAALQGLSAVFSGIWEAIKTTVLGIVLIICDLISGDFQSLQSDLMGILESLMSAFSSIWSGIQSTVTGIAGAIAAALSGTWNAIKSAATAAWNALKSAASSIFSAISSAISSAVSTAVSAVSSGFSSMASKASSAVSSMGSAIRSGFNSVVSFLTNLGSQASTWGSHMIQGFANGIKSAMGALLSTVKNLADQIRSFLHFTRPDRGPLRDYETWMPDMIEGLSKTLSAAAPGLVDQVRSLASEMSGALGSGSYQVAVAGVGSSIRAGGTALSQNGYSMFNRSQDPQTVHRTEISIGTIQVRDDRDLDMVTQGLYNKQDQNLRALGRRNL